MDIDEINQQINYLNISIDYQKSEIGAMNRRMPVLQKIIDELGIQEVSDIDEIKEQIREIERRTSQKQCDIKDMLDRISQLQKIIEKLKN